MVNKIVSTGNQARLSLCVGVDTLANAVKATLGPAGRYVVLERASASPHLTKDGASVARTVELHGRIENAGARIVQQAAHRTANDVGDGTTTTTVLVQAIYREGIKHLAVGADASRLKHGIDLATQAALSALGAMSTPCDNPIALRQVATLAANGDDTIGALVAEALGHAGSNGAVRVEVGQGIQSTLSLEEGMQWDVGFASHRFGTDPPSLHVRLDSPMVLIAAGTLDALQSLLMLMERVAASRRALVIVAEDFSADVMALLVANAYPGPLGLCAVKAPGAGERRRDLMEDLALLVGSRVVDSAAGDTLDALDLPHLGRVSRFDSGLKKTVFVGGCGDPQSKQVRLDQLRQRASHADDVSNRAWLQERIAMLTGAVALIRVGAATELEYLEKVDRAHDALRTARAAMHEGLVPGGGVAYLRARSAVRTCSVGDQDVAAGVAAVDAALQAPFLCILGNAGFEALPILAKVERLPRWDGLNVATGQYGNLRDMGVLDATTVVRSALRNAASASGQLLTTECVVTCA